MTTYSDERGDRAERLSRLDQLEREITIERERLNRSDTGGVGDARGVGDDRVGDARGVRDDDRVGVGGEPPGRERPARSANVGDRPAGSVRTVDLPELEERVTESQREAWALGYQAGVADSQTRTGSPTQNPFHPLRG